MGKLRNCTFSVNRSKPFGYRAYCCQRPELAVKELQEILVQKCFIKIWLNLCAGFFFFRWTAILTVIFHALEVWPPWNYVFLILVILSPFLLPALGRASWPPSVSRSGSPQPCFLCLPWSLSDLTHELSNHPHADVSQIYPFLQNFCFLSRLKSFSVLLTDK